LTEVAETNQDDVEFLQYVTNTIRKSKLLSSLLRQSEKNGTASIRTSMKLRNGEEPFMLSSRVYMMRFESFVAILLGVPQMINAG